MEKNRFMLTHTWIVVTGLLCLSCLGVLGAPSTVLASEPSPHKSWSAGATMGFLANTPDDTAFALNFNAEAKISQQFSIGPLLQNWASLMISFWWDFLGKGNTP